MTLSRPLICARPVIPGGIEFAPLRLRRGDQVGLGEDDWAGSDNAHIADEDVDELGKFVDAQFPQRLPHAGDILIGVFQLMGGNLAGSRHIHGTELENQERYIVTAHTLLDKQRLALWCRAHI